MSKIQENVADNGVREFAGKLFYRLFLAPRGFGKPISYSVLEKKYREGGWDFLNTIDELANYMIVVGYIQHFARDLENLPKVLDLGCGTGNVAELLDGYPLGKYLGVDISEEAIKEARKRNMEKCEFLKESFENWRPPEAFDFVISTGAIHYAVNPWIILEKYAENLTENGKLIISLWRQSVNKGIWRKIEDYFKVVDSTVVINKKGVIWDVKVLQK